MYEPWASDTPTTRPTTKKEKRKTWLIVATLGLGLAEVILESGILGEEITGPASRIADVLGNLLLGL